MSIGDPLKIQRMDEYGDWSDYLSLHALNVNKKKSRESEAGGGEHDIETVGFRLRWSPKLAEVEFDKPSFSIVWRGYRFDIRRYDDYQYHRRTVDIEAVSIGKVDEPHETGTGSGTGTGTGTGTGNAG